MSTLAIAASFSGLFMGLSSVPQIIRIIKRKIAGDISITIHLIIFIGALVWLLYGIELQNYPIVFSNFIGLILNATIIFLFFLYRDRLPPKLKG
jgi:MtN3 and saliva related transmembrane protein